MGFVTEKGRPFAEIAGELVPGGGTTRNWAKASKRGHPEPEHGPHHLARILGEPHDSPRFER